MNFKTKIIKIEGKNLESFFQNLITNDIKLLKNNQALYTAMLSPQGKFLFDFIIIEEKSKFLLEVNENDIESLITLIKKYDLRDSINTTIEKKLHTSFLLYEDVSSSILKDVKKSKILKTNNNFIFSDPRKDSFLIRIWSSQENLQELHNNLCINRSDINLNLVRIKNLIPDSSIDLEKNKSFILNFNFDLLNAISFTKGCYLGQENTSRQNYRGKIKYTLRTIKLINGNFPELHETIFVNNQKIGTMKSYHGNYGLALLRTDYVKINNQFTLDKCNSELIVI